MKPALVALALTAGCSSIVPSTVARLSALSPLKADPKDIAIALDLPDTVAIREGSAQMVMTATRKDTSETSQETYVLATKSGTDGSVIYAISQSDFARIRQQQTLIRGWKDAVGRNASGSIGIELEGCSLGAGPDEDEVMSINLRTAADGPFYPLVRDTPVVSVLEYTKLEALEPCA